MKKDFLESLKEIDNFTYTENGAGAWRSTGNPVLDAFASLGVMKDASEHTILDTFYASFRNDPDLSMKLLFYIRDIRGGQGMRRVFRIILRSLANTDPEYVINNMSNILFYGRGDDYLVLFDTKCEDAMLKEVETVLREDMKSVINGGMCSLLAKWMPSENTSSCVTKNYARRMISGLKVTPREYRKMLSTLRNKIDIVETKMSQNNWEDIDFNKLPSHASMIYSDAFSRHVEELYLKYISNLSTGSSKVNASALFPVDIIKRVSELYSPSKKDRLLHTAMWNSLPNYLENAEETGICMCDTSGSMSGIPLYVSLSLGMYCADKCHGPFKNHFITFDYEPVLQEITGADIYDKVHSIRSINPANTNFEAALQLILDAAVKDNLPQSDLPSKLYVISDMQFDEATGESHTHSPYYRGNKFEPFMQKMKRKFEDAGYTMPAIVYWNVRTSNCGMFQETVDGENCCMVSGYSPSLFKSVIDGTEYVEVVDEDGTKSTSQKIDPMHVMLTTLNGERYDRVWTKKMNNV